MINFSIAFSLALIFYHSVFI